MARNKKDNGGGGGGGTITGGGVPNQVAYWNGATNITGDGFFTYDPLINHFTVGTNGGALFDLNPSSQQVVFNIGINGFLVNDLGGNTALEVDTVNKIVFLGDVDGTANLTTFELDDSSQDITANLDGSFIVRNSTNASDVSFYINYPNRQYILGDVNTQGNGTILNIDDTAQSISSTVQLGGGDYVNNTLNTSGGSFQLISGGNNWGFAVSPAGGGQTTIYANSTAFTWPNADGALGDVLTTNGAGVLTFAPNASGNIGGTIAATQVAYGSALDTITGDNTFTRTPTNFTVQALNGGNTAELQVDANLPNINTFVSNGVDTATLTLDTTGQFGQMLYTDATHTVQQSIGPAGFLSAWADNALNASSISGGSGVLRLENNDGAGNTQAWLWPQTDGNAGDAVTTDGAGNLAFTAITGTIGGTINTNQIGFGSALNTLTSGADMTWDPVSKIFSVGDITSTGNDNKFILNDTTGVAALTASLAYGVYDPAGNLWQAIYPGFHQANQGDISGAFNHTTFSVDDLNRSITGQAILAGVGGSFRIRSTDSEINYANAGTNYGFSADSTGGGRTVITSNNQQWIWPTVDGIQGDTLFTDGNGTLAFGAGGSVDPSAALAVVAATTTALPALTYNNGVAGVGATLTANANGALPAQDGTTLVATDRLLVKNQATTLQNGVYEVTQIGNGGAPFILTRTTDSDEDVEFDNQIVVPSTGTTQQNQIFGQTTQSPVVGTDPIVYITVTNTYVTQSVTGTQTNLNIPFWTGNPRQQARGDIGLQAPGATFALGQLRLGKTNQAANLLMRSGTNVSNVTIGYQNATTANAFLFANIAAGGEMRHSIAGTTSTETFYSNSGKRVEIGDQYLSLSPYGVGAGNTMEARFLELAANGTNYVGFKAPGTLAGNVIWTLPSTDSTGTQALVSNGSATFSWATIPSAGVTTMAAIGASPNANGANISGTTLNLEPASASFGGVVTTGSQQFAGSKTFNSQVNIATGSSLVLGELSTSTGSVLFRNATNNNTLTLQSGVSGANFSLTLPTALPTANDQVLVSTTGGVTSWGGVVTSGTYTVTEEAAATSGNVTAHTFHNDAMYTRIGNVVMVAGSIDITATAASTQFGLVLPIASNIAGLEGVCGTANSNTEASLSAAIRGDATNNCAVIDYIGLGTGNETFYYTYQYYII